MSSLVAFTFPNHAAAASAAAELKDSSHEDDHLDDSAWLSRSLAGSFRLHQCAGCETLDQPSDSLWPFILGLLSLVSTVGVAIGSASGSVATALEAHGIDYDWIKEISISVPVGGSALLLKTSDSSNERRMADALSQYGRMIEYQLTASQEAALAFTFIRDCTDT